MKNCKTFSRLAFLFTFHYQNIIEDFVIILLMHFTTKNNLINLHGEVDLGENCKRNRRSPTENPQGDDQPGKRIILQRQLGVDLFRI